MNYIPKHCTWAKDNIESYGTLRKASDAQDISEREALDTSNVTSVLFASTRGGQYEPF